MDHLYFIREVDAMEHWTQVEGNIIDRKEAIECFKEEVDIDPLRHLVLVRETILKEHLWGEGEHAGE